MKVMTIAAALLVVAGMARADLQALDNDDLGHVTGQSGADMGFLLQLNQDASGAFTCGGEGQTPLQNCRLGVSFNNRDVTAGGVGTTTGAGYKTWLVFKGLQGTLNFQHIALDGTDLIYKNDDGATVEKGAILLTFDPTRPLLIRNFGFGSLSVQTDTVVNEGAGNTPGYLWMGTGPGAANPRDDYAAGVYTAAGFDNGRETGFMGLSVHGNLALSGNVKIFGCDGAHPRC